MAKRDPELEEAPSQALPPSLPALGPEVAAVRIFRGLPADPLLCRLLSVCPRRHDGQLVTDADRERISGILGPSGKVAAAVETSQARHRGIVLTHVLQPRARQIVRRIAALHRVSADDLLARWPKFQILRDMAVWAVARRIPEMTEGEIGAVFGGLGPDGVRGAIVRHRDRAGLDLRVRP